MLTTSACGDNKPTPSKAETEAAKPANTAAAAKPKPKAETKPAKAEGNPRAEPTGEEGAHESFRHDVRFARDVFDGARGGQRA